MTSEQGNPPEKGEAPKDRAAETDAAETGSTPSPETERPAEAVESEPAAESPAEEAPPAEPVAESPVAEAAPEPEAPAVDDGGTAPAAEASAAPEPEAAPEPDADATSVIPAAADESDVPAAPEQVAPAEPLAPTSPPFDDGTQILRLGPMPSPAEPQAQPVQDLTDESTQVLPPQGVSGFNAPSPYGDQPPASPSQPPASPSAWPSPPPNPLANQVPPPGPVGPPPGAPQAPPAPYGQPRPPVYQPPVPPASQQPPPPPIQSDDTQKLIIGAHNPHSEPPSAYGQAGVSQPPTYLQPGMPPGSVPPGQYPPAPAPSGGGRKPPLIPILAIAGALVVIGAAIGVYFLLFAAPTFEEGGCVRHTGGDQAEAIDCADAVDGEDYEIVQKVGDGQECADAGRETLTVDDDVYCLSLLGGEEEGDDASESPSGE